MKTTNNILWKTTTTVGASAKTATSTSTVTEGSSITTASAARGSLFPTHDTRLVENAYCRPSRTTTRLSAASDASAEKDQSDRITKYRNLFRKGINRLLPRDDDRKLGGGDTTTQFPPQISPIDPNLYMLPDSLQRYYRPLPNIVRALTVFLATWASFVSTSWNKKLPAFSFLLLRRISVFLFKSLTLTLVAQVVFQDIFFVNNKPSRVTINTLIQRHFLPSPLSKYRPITIEPILPQPASESEAIVDASSTVSDAENEPFTLGVHYLRYDNTKDHHQDLDADSETRTNPSENPQNSGKRSFDAVYFQHGFGASSLSWLPVLPTLAKQLNARVALGHDTVGFGFTDRPKDRRWYRPRQSARIARAILTRERKTTCSSDDETSPEDAAKPICLVGHSMGSRSTLRLAKQLPIETPKLIILSSPALGLIPPRTPKPSPSSKPAQLVYSLSAVISRKVVRPATMYVLRRVIGVNGFWRKGLESAWGNPKKITEDSDVLRYSWPSIGYGWEEGILNFAGGQVLSADDNLDDDYLLMREVLKLPNTKVVIVLGSQDKVIPTRSVERFVEQVFSSESSGQNSNAVPIVELEGLGHVAFEEDQETFCDAVEQLVSDHWDTRR